MKSQTTKPAPATRHRDNTVQKKSDSTAKALPAVSPFQCKSSKDNEEVSKATMQMKGGIPVNVGEELETEANMMGTRAGTVQRQEQESDKEKQASTEKKDSIKSKAPLGSHIDEQKNRSAIAATLENMLFQRKAIDEEEPFNPIQKKENNTGLPDTLKTGVENLSGFSMDDVKVHYNSDKPAQLNAHAYAQGANIHIAPGQEKHLPHEAWHVVQQKQGRVKATMQMKGGIPVSDDQGLEREADEMGEKAGKIDRNPAYEKNLRTENKFSNIIINPNLIQRRIWLGIDSAKRKASIEDLVEWLNKVEYNIKDIDKGYEYTLVSTMVTDDEDRLYDSEKGQSELIRLINNIVKGGMWVASPEAVLYKNDTDDEIETGIFRYTKLLQASPPPDVKSELGRIYVEIKSGKLRGRKGWINKGDISDNFPAFDNFEIANIHKEIPPLYHGSDRASVESIMTGGFKVGRVISAGRTYGDGVYATPYVSKAAKHGANKVYMEEMNEFAVGSVKVKEKIPKESIVIHNLEAEEFLRRTGKTMEEAVTTLHPVLGPKAISMKPKAVPLSHIDITAAAKALEKEVVIYKGKDGHIVYVFTKADSIKIEQIVVEGVNPNSSRNWETLDWYHEAQDRDRIQGEMNKLG